MLKADSWAVSSVSTVIDASKREQKLGLGDGYGAGAAFVDDSDSYSYFSNFAGGANAAQASGAFGQQGLSAVSVANAGLGSSAFGQQSSAASIYATTAQGLYADPNPQVIRRAAASAPQTYTQRVVVRFLQPPPVPPPGVSFSIRRKTMISLMIVISL